MRSDPTRSLRDVPTLLLGLLILSNSLFVYWQNTSHSQKIDFFTLWAVPQAISCGIAVPIYSHDGQKELAAEMTRQAALPDTSEMQRQVTRRVTALYNSRIDATATPLLYAATGLLSCGCYEQDLLRFTASSAICLLFSILILCQMLGFTWISSGLAAAFFCLFYLPILSDLQTGNMNQILLFILTLYLVSWKREAPIRTVLSGMILGAGILLKPILGIIFVFELIRLMIGQSFRRLFDLLAGCGLGAVGGLLLSSVFFGTFSIWIDFARSLPRTLGFSYPLSHGNYSLPALLFLLTGRNFSIILLLLITAVFIWICLAMLRDSEEENREKLIFCSAGMGCAALPLASGLAWLHYYVLLIPLILLVIHLAKHTTCSPKPRILIQSGVWLTVFLFTPVGSMVTGMSPVSRCIAFNIAIIALILLLLVSIQSPAPETLD